MMESVSQTEKPHAVCIPYPVQGHITPMLMLAKLLHHRGFYITFVNTDYNHRRLLQSRGPNSLDGLQDFKFRTIPDGLPYSDANCTQDIPALCESTSKNCLAPFCDLISQLNSMAASPSSNMPPVSCIVSDAIMSFSMLAANEFKIPYAFLWTASACGYLGYFQYEHLINQGLIPLKDMSQLTDGYLETTIGWTQGMKNIRLRDLPTFLRTTNLDDIMINFILQEMKRSREASTIILNTFDAIEGDVKDSLSSILQSIYTIGPLHMLGNKIDDEKLTAIGSNLWAEESKCIEWLNSKQPDSVVYVNFGSITVMTPQQMVEFAWGLADSGKPFLWITRPDLIVGDSAIMPQEFVTQTKDRSLISSWCSQEQTLKILSAFIIDKLLALIDDIDRRCQRFSFFIYTIGPLHMLSNQIDDENLTAIGSNLLAEESESIEWLNSKQPNSVVYVNFGSITVMTPQQLIEFAWGFADSGKPLLWITRPDLIVGDSAIMPQEFVTQTKDRSMIASWCSQEQVLNHPSIGGFVTHSGWNSTLERVYVLSKAEEAYKPGGSACKQLDKLINEVLLSNIKKKTEQFPISRRSRNSMMESVSQTEKPHAVCIPYPVQGHITPMLMLAKLLHHRGFYITFVNTDYNHRRLLQSRGPNSLDGLQDFKFRTIPDGLPYSDANCTQDIPALCESTSKNCLAPFCDLISQLNSMAASPSSNMPPVSCIVSDAVMSFSMLAANEFKIPHAFLWTASACGYLGYFQYEHLIKQGLIPLKDMDQVTNGYLETTIEWTQGMKNIRLRDLPTFLRTTNLDDIMLNFLLQEMKRSREASTIILSTFDAIEGDVKDSLSSILQSIYTIGPLHMLGNKIDDEKLTAIGSNLWVEESECIEWLNSKQPNSVVYLNFGSITVMTPQQMVEFAWGLADSGKPFLWITRPDLIVGNSAIMPQEFVTQTKDRSLIASGSAYKQLDKLINEVLLSNIKKV
ncbi:hypothetical protein Csa_017231 [Cucumis sativus]|nr:hypothetical protein Csa_017231 [Cucumis sativus]